MTTAQVPLRLTCLRGQCTAAIRQPAHHDRLLTVDTDTDVLLELLEIAVTWRELDYSEVPVIGPCGWRAFADEHAWRYPERASRAFSLALDIVGRRTAPPVPEQALAQVIELVQA